MHKKCCWFYSICCCCCCCCCMVLVVCVHAVNWILLLGSSSPSLPLFTLPTSHLLYPNSFHISTPFLEQRIFFFPSPFFNTIHYIKDSSSPQKSVVSPLPPIPFLDWRQLLPEICKNLHCWIFEIVWNIFIIINCILKNVVTFLWN